MTYEYHTSTPIGHVVSSFVCFVYHHTQRWNAYYQCYVRLLVTSVSARNVRATKTTTWFVCWSNYNDYNQYQIFNDRRHHFDVLGMEQRFLTSYFPVLSNAEQTCTNTPAFHSILIFWLVTVEPTMTSFVIVYISYWVSINGVFIINQ